MTKIILKAIILLSIFYMWGCNEQPTELGYKIDSVTFTAISSHEEPFITGTKSQRYYLSSFNVGVFQVGKAGEYSSYPILRYGNIDSLEGTELISATLHLIRSKYAFGDTTGLQSFEIYEVEQQILPTSTYETLFKSIGEEQIYKDELMGQFEQSYSDIKDTTKVTLNTQLIQNWIDFSVLESDTLNPLDTNDPRRRYSYSIGLKPTENSKVITAFLTERVGNSGATAPNPFIEVIYKRNGVQDTVNLRANIAAFYSDGPTPDANSLTVQSGLSARSQISFDLSALPQFASIVKAVLKIYVDDSRTLTGTLGKDSILLAQKDLTFNDGFFPSNENLYLGIRSKGTNYYRFSSISSAVEDWLTNDKTGTLLLNYAQNGNPGDTHFRLDRYYLYGAEADSILRPELTIFYAKRPDF